MDNKEKLNGKIKRYDNDLIIRRLSNGDLLRPRDEVLGEIKKAFFPNPSFPKPPGVYFYVEDYEVADRLGLWEREYYHTSYGDFLELIGDILSDPHSFSGSCEGEYIPIIFGTNKDEVLKRARESVIFPDPTPYPPKLPEKPKPKPEGVLKNVVPIKKELDGDKK